MASQSSVNVVDEVIQRLRESSGMTTATVRSVSSSLFRQIEDRRIDHVLDLCEALLDRRRWELGVVAYDWAFRMKRAYTEQAFDRFDGWLKR